MRPDLLEHLPCSVPFWSPPGDGKAAGGRFSRAGRWPEAIEASEMKQTIFLWELWYFSHANPVRNQPGWLDLELIGGAGEPVSRRQSQPSSFRRRSEGASDTERGGGLAPSPTVCVSTPRCPRAPGQVLPAGAGGCDPPARLLPAARPSRTLPAAFLPRAARPARPKPRALPAPAAEMVLPERDPSAPPGPERTLTVPGQVAAAAARRGLTCEPPLPDIPPQQVPSFRGGVPQLLAQRPPQLRLGRSALAAHPRRLRMPPWQPRSAPALLAGDGRRRPHGAAGQPRRAAAASPPPRAGGPSFTWAPPAPAPGAALPPPASLPRSLPTSLPQRPVPRPPLSALLSSPALRPPRGGEGAPASGPAPALTGTPRPRARAPPTDRDPARPVPKFRDPTCACGPHLGTARPSGCPAVSSRCRRCVPWTATGSCPPPPQTCRPSAANAAPGTGHPPRGDRKPGWQQDAFFTGGCNRCFAHASTFAERKLGVFFSEA